MGDEPVETFARRIDVPLRTVQRWRSGESEPRSRDLVVLAAALGYEPAWFFEDPNGEPAEAVA